MQSLPLPSSNPSRTASLPAPPGPVRPGGASSAGPARPVHRRPTTAGGVRSSPQDSSVPGVNSAGTTCFSDLSTTFIPTTKRRISQDAPEPKLHTQIIVQKYLYNYRPFRRLLRPPWKSEIAAKIGLCRDGLQCRERPCPSATFRGSNVTKEPLGAETPACPAAFQPPRGPEGILFLMTHVPAVTARTSSESQHCACSVRPVGPLQSAEALRPPASCARQRVSAEHVLALSSKASPGAASRVRFPGKASRPRAGRVSSRAASLLILAPVPATEELTNTLSGIHVPGKPVPYCPRATFNRISTSFGRRNG